MNSQMSRHTVTTMAISGKVKLHVEITGAGDTILFLHEFGGDHRSWEPQIRYFARRYQCVTYAARGYPPSDVPTNPDAYSQDLAVQDAIAVLDQMGAERVHLVGLSMGGFAALHLTMEHPRRVASVALASCGWGAEPHRMEQFRSECQSVADAFATQEMTHVAQRYAEGPTRVQLQAKDPRGWEEFRDRLAEHDPTGAALTMRGVQARRPSLYEMADRLTSISNPVMIIVGDEDDGCLEPGLFLKRTISTSALTVLPRTGHSVNLEDPSAFNDAVGRFLADAIGDWPNRDPRALPNSYTGIHQAGFDAESKPELLRG